MVPKNGENVTKSILSIYAYTQPESLVLTKLQCTVFRLGVDIQALTKGLEKG